jgi:hypothetical protein
MPDAFIPVYDDDLGQVVLDGLPAGAAGGAGLRPATGLELIFDRADGHLAQAIIDPGESGAPTECPGGLAALFGPGGPEAIRAAVTGRGPVRALSPDPGLLAAWSRLARLDEARVTSPVPPASVLWAAESAMVAGRGGLRPRARAEARSAVAGLAELLEPGPVPDGLSRAARAVADLAEADEPRAARRLREILGQVPAAPAERWLADRASVPERHADRERQWERQRERQCPGAGWVVIPHLQWSLDPRLIPGRVLVPGLSPRTDLAVHGRAGSDQVIVEAVRAAGADEATSRCWARVVDPALRRVLGAAAFRAVGPDHRVRAEICVPFPVTELSDAWVEVVDDPGRPVQSARLHRMRRALRYADAALRAEQAPRGLAPSFATEDWSALAARAWRDCRCDWLAADDAGRAELAGRPHARDEAFLAEAFGC